MAKKIDINGIEWKQTRKGWVNQKTQEVVASAKEIPSIRKADKKHEHKKVGSLRDKRSDAKAINATNCIFVARKAIEAHLAAGESLTPMMEDF